MPKILFLITNSFPYGDGEAFLETEIFYLSRRFEQVYIIPNLRKESCARKINHENVLILPPIYVNRFYSIFHILFNLNDLFFILKELKQNYSQLTFFSIFKCIIIGLKTRAYKKLIESKVRKYNPLEDSILYFYWGNVPANSVILFSKKVKCFIRFHGGDLYEELPIHKGKIFYRAMLLERAAFNIFISEHGYSYTKIKYSNISFRHIICRLGVKFVGLSKRSNDGYLRIVTCSNVTQNKRINLVVEALKTYTSKLVWTHIGNGPLLPEIEESAKRLPSNIHCVFLRQISNFEVRKFYLDNMVDLFINVSESEGVPVTIMEALSAGIPIIATNVGGTSELIDETVGFLLESDFSIHELTDKMYEFNLLNTEDINRMRYNALQRFKKMSDASILYSLFAQILYEQS
jgi:colanic acid/amylovoran biosynthesis glycosyltransferase